MPFTLSHPAAAIPLSRTLGRYAMLPALVIGSMSPDFPYFSPLRVGRLSTHTLWGVVWFCVPATVVSYFVFERLLKRPLASLLPVGVAARLGPLEVAPLTVSRLIAVAVCAFTGALTHVVWDSFTHGDGQVVVAVPQLHVLVVQVGSYRLWLYKLLQHASSVAGALLLIFWLVDWYRATPPTRPAPGAAIPLPAVVRYGLLATALVLAISFGVTRGLLRAPDMASIGALQVFSWYFIVGTVGFFAASLGVFAATWQLLAWCRVGFIRNPSEGPS
jgi:hypothetical protein